jgi:hypothetical protein
MSAAQRASAGDDDTGKEKSEEKCAAFRNAFFWSALPRAAASTIRGRNVAGRGRHAASPFGAQGGGA